MSLTRRSILRASLAAWPTVYASRLFGQSMPAASRPTLDVASLPPIPDGLFTAADVKLLPGSPFFDRQELHRTKKLASYEPDRLLFHYRALAGLPQPAGVDRGYAGWDSAFLRGHMVGHYLSAASRMHAATGDAIFRDRATYIVAELAKCQDALKLDGYLAAFPTGALDAIEGKRGAKTGGVVVPFYTLHKIMAGLLDAHAYLGNAQALQVVEKMAGYIERRLAALDPATIEKMFRTDGSRNPQNEFGAMGDVLAELYKTTRDARYLQLARTFNRPWFVGPLARGEDHLAGLHANTHIAQAVGFANTANAGGDATEAAASANFWTLVARDHSFANGGNSVKEWFDKPRVETGPSIDADAELPATTCETCNSHNMLRLTARLMERGPSPEFGDYSERALYNHVLASVAPDTGEVTYFTPLRGRFRTYLDGTFCCTGTGIENTPRYNENIYFRRGGDALWINLYVPSQLTWRDAGLVLRQEGDVSRGEPVRVTVVGATGEAPASISLRIPHWIAGPATLKLNDAEQDAGAKPSSYVTIRRVWKAGDVLTLALPAALRAEPARDAATLAAIFYGPVLLAGELGSEGMPRDFGDKDAHLKTPPADVPDVRAASADPAKWLAPVANEPLTFRATDAGPASGITFRPLYAVHHQRYSVYWRLGQA